MNRSIDRREERGASLILALIFIGLIGVIAVALGTYNQAVFKQIPIVRKVNLRETGTNAGLDWAVQAIRSRSALCFENGAGFQLLTINGREVKVYCKVTNGTASGPGGWALYITPGGQIATEAGGSAPIGKTIIGPIYNAGGWDLKADLTVDGEVVVPNGLATCTNNTLAIPVAIKPRLSTTFSTFRECAVPQSAVYWVPPPPDPPVAPAPTPAANCSDAGTGKIKTTDCTPNAADPVSVIDPATGIECRTFSPGTYSDPPRLAATNYFKPGVYRFDWNAAKSWIITSSIYAGDPIPFVERRESTVAKCAGNAPAAPYGVSFVFSRKANMEVRNSGRVELFSHQNGDGVLPGVIADGSTLSGGQLLVDIGQGTKPELVIHGGVYAPGSSMRLRATNTGIAKVMATTVVNTLTLDASASISQNNFGVVVPSGAGFKKYRLIAISTKVGSEPEFCSVASVTVFNDAISTSGVNSWRVDRDPRSTDPANCSP